MMADARILSAAVGVLNGDVHNDLLGIDVPVAPLDTLFWVFLGLGIVSSVLAIVTVVCLARVHYFEKSWTIQKLLQLLIFMCNVVRSIFFFGVHFHWETITRGENEQNADSILNGRGFPTLFFVLNELPGVLFFSASTVLLLQWAKIHYTVRDDITVVNSWFKPTCVTGNVCVYIMQGSLWILYGLSNHFPNLTPAIEPLHVTSSITMALIFAITGIILIVFGNRTRDTLSEVPMDFRLLSDKVSEIRFLGIVCTVCFTLRACFICYGTVASLAGLKDNLPGITPCVALSVYYLCFEIAPCTIMLYYFRRLPPPPPQTNNPSASLLHSPPVGGDTSYTSMEGNSSDMSSPVTAGPSSGGGYRSAKRKSKFGFDQESPGARYAVNTRRT
jgi:hypothetical protein